jgi:sensor c-di-GMP phosphodiesterase-like protein
MIERANKQHVLVARTVTTTLAVSGILAGYFLSRIVAFERTESALDRYATGIVAQRDAASGEGRKLLAAMKSSPYAACSDADIAYLRDLLYRSQYLKDAGYLHAGRVDCSAASGHPARVNEQLRTDSALQAGAVAYINLLPGQGGSNASAGLEMGNAYVLFNEHLPVALSSIPMQLTESVRDVASAQAGRATGKLAQAKRFDSPGDELARSGDTVYATHCSNQYSNCATAHTTVSDALRVENGTLGCGLVLGGLTGGFLGLAFSTWYRRRQGMEHQLRRAIARDKLDVLFQPIVNLSTGKIVGAESLVRWRDEEGLDVGPETFVKIAEENGFVGSITKLVVLRALDCFADTLRSRPGFRLSVNVTATDLADPKFLPMLDDALRYHRVQSKSLAIEITESSTANREVAMETIRALSRRGHSIHIDDFGTGYSSLSYLLYLSVDTIKIDKAFTRAIGTESVTVAILPQILAMAESLHMEVVVEGVETGQQANYFSATEKPMYGQGWLYGHPVPAGEFLGLLADDSSKAAITLDAAIPAQPVAGPVLVAIRRSA